MDFQENAKNNFDTEFIQNVQKNYQMEQNIKNMFALSTGFII